MNAVSNKKSAQWHRSFLTILTFLAPAAGLTANTTLVNTSSAYFIGTAYMYSARTGYYDFDEIKQSRQIDRGDLHSFGVVAGKRYALGPIARVQLGIGFDMGSATDDTLYFTIDNEPAPTEVRYAFVHCGLDPELQFPLPAIADNHIRPYLMAGGGINFLYLKEHTYFLGDGEVLFTNQPYVEQSRFSFDGAAGLGFDWSVTRNATLGVSYSLRYWRPVRYVIRRDFPLNGQNYHETFLSHKLSVALLLEFK
jgi:hypothetical protein